MMGEPDANMLSYMTDLQVRLGSVGGPRTWPSVPKREGQRPGKLFCLGTHFSWQVEHVRHGPDCRRIVLFFASNPYFRDQLVVKEYVTSDSGKRRLRLWRQQAWARGRRRNDSHPPLPTDSSRRIPGVSGHAGSAVPAL